MNSVNKEIRINIDLHVHRVKVERVSIIYRFNSNLVFINSGCEIFRFL